MGSAPRVRRWGVLVAVLALGGCSTADSDAARPAPTLPHNSTSSAPARSIQPAAGNPWGAVPAAGEVVARGLQVGWGLAFLPDGSALVSERDTGRILRLRPHMAPAEVARLPVAADGEGGLLGIAVAPTYARDHLIYAYYTSATDNRIVRLVPGGASAAVLAGIPKNSFHDGGRLAFGPDGMLYAATGDAGDRPHAQDPASLSGKILRLRPDGRVPADNPTPGSPVWSLGHRNVQGLAWDVRGRLYATEFGQNRFDEVNLIRKGANYGWPEVEGSGGAPRYVDPLLTWSPADASPSGAAFAGGYLFVAALRGERLWQIRFDSAGGAPQARGLFLGRYGRLRTVAAGPDGGLWLVTSNRDGRGDPRPGDDKVIRIPVPG